MFEQWVVFSKGLLVGFSLAMVLGPIGLFCIQQTLRRGFRAGFVAGLGAATADGIFGTIAGFGLTYICDILMRYQSLLQLIGGIFLLYLGISTFNHIAQPAHIASEKSNLFALYTTTLFLTLANPMTILVFAALLTSIGIEVDRCSSSLAFTLFISVFLGSTAWWLILTGTFAAFRTKISMHWIELLNKVAGILIALFGALIAARAVLKFVTN